MTIRKVKLEDANNLLKMLVSLDEELQDRWIQYLKASYLPN